MDFKYYIPQTYVLYKCFFIEKYESSDNYFDTFIILVNAGTNKLVRKSSDSAVTIPDRVPFATLIKEADKARSSSSEFPEHNARACGLPQRLLLPKGNSEGMQISNELK